MKTIKRLIRFFKIIWCDVGLTLPEMIIIPIMAIIVSAVILSPIAGLAWVLCKTMDRPFDADAMGGVAGLILFLWGVGIAIKYLRDKWKETK